LATIARARVEHVFGAIRNDMSIRKHRGVD
jgi:hypothetical protein